MGGTTGRRYPTDLTDEQWAILEPLFPRRAGPGRPRALELREVVNAILYLTRTGCQWRMLPKDFPNYNSVRYYFDCWTFDGTWERINTALREAVRVRVGRIRSRAPRSSTARASRRPRSAGSGATTPAKKVNGRKRHILVDTLGNLIKAVVHPADFQDAEGAELVLHGLRASFRRLATLWADRAYEAAREWIEGELGVALEIVAKAADQKGFVALPKRWIVERTLAWLSRNRRLSKDYEHDEAYSASMVYVASIHLLLRKLAA